MTKPGKLDKDSMKKNNMELIFTEIYQAGACTRPQLARQSGMSIVSVSRITDRLMELGLIREVESPRQDYVGRPPKLLEVASEKLLFPCASLDNRGGAVGIVDARGHTLCKREMKVREAPFQAEDYLNEIGTEMKSLLSQHKEEKIFPVLAIAVPGIVEPESGQVLFSAQLQGENIDVAGILRKASGISHVVVENDVKALALAENLYGDLKGFSNAVILSLGSGIGAAAIINHAVYRGQNNMAGEIGHIVIAPGGKLCECGKIGCLQTNITDGAILKEAHAVYPDITLEQFFACCQTEPWAIRLMDKTLDYIFLAMNLLSNTYAPEAIMLCGSLITGNSVLASLIESNYAKRLRQGLDNPFQLKFTRLGKDYMLAGAGTAAFYYAVGRMIQ